MRRTYLATMLLVLLPACAPGTDVSIEARGLPGFSIEDGDTLMTVGEDGRVGYATRRLASRGSGEAARIIDAESGAEYSIVVSRGDDSVALAPFCLPPSLDEGPNATELDGITFLLRREIASGNCFLIALSARADGSTFVGEYTPENFDDAPCGPFQ